MTKLRFPDIEVYYKTLGTGSPCLMMHGLGFDHTFLSPWLDRLSELYQVVYYDQRYHGRSSSAREEALTLEQLADDAERLRVSLKLPPTAVLGHSSGALVAFEYALRHPASVRHLILMNPFPAWDVSFDFLAQARKRGATPQMLAAYDFATITSEAVFRERWRTVAPLYFTGRTSHLADVIGQDTVFAPAALLQAFARLREYDRVPQLSTIQVPVLVMTGEEDFIATPRHVHDLGSQLPAGTVRVLPRTCHFPFAEDPDLCTAVVRDWLQSISSVP